MMYILFRDKNWKPSDYFLLPYGEKIVVRAFLRQEMEERAERQRLMKGDGSL